MTRSVRVTVTGRVQGVGFRPTVYRYAVEAGIAGFVRNTSSGVVIEAGAGVNAVADFLERVRKSPPKHARIDTFLVEELGGGFESDSFEIVPSRRSGDLVAGMPPDIATCADCREEILSEDNRRSGYAFTNCTNCGPRFTIIGELPYDRAATSMSSFAMCEACSLEYNNPESRRFDAQPNACPDCGPRLKLIDRDGRAVGGDPLAETARLVKEGGIVAIKGLGGYHLCCNALDEAALDRLRGRKKRPHKPLAAMFASVEQAAEHCEIRPRERQLLESPAAPIVVLRRKHGSSIPGAVSPDTPDVGVFLPYTPLHHLLLRRISPLVMTSGNLAEEPIVREEDALGRILGEVADYALVHDRVILRRCDDSVLRVVDDDVLLLRRARGFVPDGIELPLSGPPVLACGAELKNTFCITRNDTAFMSQHIGDLTEHSAHDFFTESVEDLEALLGISPQIIAHDMHPDYLSTGYATARSSKDLIPVQHHHAHVAACMAEHGVIGPVVGVALDGTGFGPDGTVWGGEFLVADLRDFRRRAHFKQYGMPGSQNAIVYPPRMALSVLREEVDGWQRAAEQLLPSLSPSETDLLAKMLRKGVRSPVTSSAGRLFDAVSSLLGLCNEISYEGQAAIRLQTAASDDEDISYEFELDVTGAPAVVSFGPAIRGIVRDIMDGKDSAAIAAAFHNTVAAAVVRTCDIIRSADGIETVVLSGGVFQNDRLLRQLTRALRADGWRVYSHCLVPPNDGGVALGQAAVALARTSERV